MAIVLNFLQCLFLISDDAFYIWSIAAIADFLKKLGQTDPNIELRDLFNSKEIALTHHLRLYVPWCDI